MRDPDFNEDFTGDHILKTLLIALSTTTLMALMPIAAHAALDDAKAQDIMKKAGCAVCHTADKRIVGPAYKDVALKHKAEPGAAAALEKAVREGSKGVYGAIPMPPNTEAKISSAEIHEMIEWILTK